ncbi:CDP-alcohol phosphatidyltransferase family protein [Nakamurella deserti]|uniref:CDP-alcohol phosphatidyltransferase family protein n=1 Tax=Nakamurella deserti TaxID=2164074 RepID=UPI000DBE95F1|nr:phosphatidylcholine/phosphatidylserine synthase [Nakamurella deserti]
MPAVPGVRFLPNAITALALATGLTSVVFATQGQFMTAMVMIGVAAVLDALDGPAARLLNSSSRVGAELDSLSDLSNFGICPAILLYIWQDKTDTLMVDELWFVWGGSLVYAVCTALRLARFNSLLDDTEPKPFEKNFFTGIPSPPGALLAIVPILVYVQFDGFTLPHWLVAIWSVGVGLLMVSRFPTIALKSIRVPPKAFVPLIVILVFALVTFVFLPRVVALIGLAVYLAHIPWAAARYRYLAAHPELWDNRRTPRTRRSRRSLRLAVRARRAPARWSEGGSTRWVDGGVPRQRMRDPRQRQGGRRDGAPRRNFDRD